MTKKLENTSNLPANLKKSLTSNNMTAADLARKSGVSMASLSRIISGQVNPTLDNVMKIAKILGTSIDMLAGQPSFTSINNTTSAKKNKKASETKLGYNPETEIVASFTLTGTNYSVHDAGKLLQEAARGNWVQSWSEEFVDQSVAKKVRLLNAQQTTKEKISVNLVFPHELVEEGSIVSLMSIVASATTGTGAYIDDIRIPASLVRTYQYPIYGVRGFRDTLNKFGRPLLSTTIRPMVGLSPRMYGRAILETLKGGMDITCDPTMMHSQPASRWRERYRFAAEATFTASAETNETKLHVVNVSAPTVEEMILRAEFAKELGLRSVLVDSAAVGWTALASLSKWCTNNEMILCAMGGRSLQSGMVSEQLIAKLLRFSGCDVVSIGSPLRGSIDYRRKVNGIIHSLRDDDTAPFTEGGVLFDQPTCGFPASIPACGGGHNPWHFPRLIDAMGDDMIIQCGGSVMGHPWGGASGSIANRTAIEAIVQAREEGHNLTVDGRMILQRAARYNAELKTSLEYWQEGSFLFGVIGGGETSDTSKLDAKVVVSLQDKTTPTQPTIDK